MKALKIKTQLISDFDNEFKEFIGKMDDNVIYYQDGNIDVTITLEPLTIERISSEYELIMSFKSKTKTNFINRILNNEVLIETYCEFVKKDEKSLEIEYYINDSKYIFKMNYEVIL